MQQVETALTNAASATASAMPMTETLKFATEALLCATVGDEVSYVKNLRKMAATDASPEQQITAQRLLHSFEWVRDLRKNVLRKIDQIRCLGSETLACMLSATVHLPNIEHISRGMWGYCCISGALSAHTVQVQHEGSTWCADARYEFCLCAVWTASNIPAIEASRLLPLVQASSASGAASLSHRIGNILSQHDKERMQAIETYERAIRHAFKSLEMTAAKLAQDTDAMTVSNAVTPGVTSEGAAPRVGAPSVAH